jgi:hypothetical protein
MDDFWWGVLRCVVAIASLYCYLWGWSAYCIWRHKRERDKYHRRHAEWLIDPDGSPEPQDPISSLMD